MSKQHSISSGLLWKLLERFGVQGVQFVLQLVLARVLDPVHYGSLSIIIIFTNLAQVFIQAGLSTALIQNADVTEEDYSSVFWVTFLLALVSYVVLFFAAPTIAVFYNMPEIVDPFRVIALMLFPGALNSVQMAKVSRELDFKKVFYGNVGASILSGVTGIVLAALGAGLWALVVQTLLSICVVCVTMWFMVDWRPRLLLRWNRVRVLFSFGWKLLVSGLLDTLYTNLSSLIVGKKYDADTLAYYNRGNNFPMFITNSINSAVQTVLLPAMSAKQNSADQVKGIMRTSIIMSSYIILPMMAGLAAVATPMVKVLLTDKWLPCVPYLQIFCFALAFYPIHSSNVQAINAMGRSDIFLKLEVIKKVIGIIVLAVAVFAFDTPIAIASSGILTTVLSFLINAYPNKKLVNYSYFEQIKDILPSLLLSLAMFFIVLPLQNLALAQILILIIQIAAGAVFYVGLSALLKLQPFLQLLQIVKKLLK